MKADPLGLLIIIILAMATIAMLIDWTRKR